ncbi:MAG: hypothetical protein ACXWWQ_00010 [Candidatus Limnocylindria bacterium]
MHRAAAMLAAVMVLAGCGAGPGASEPAPSAPPVEFDLDVVPVMSGGRAIPDEPVIFLVTVSGSADDGPVSLAVEAAGATVSAEPEELQPGVVGEVTVVPAEVDEERELAVKITAARSGVERQQARSVRVVPGEDSLGPRADQLLERFASWLAIERPELGIGPETEWEGMPGSWVLVVSHYLYFSDEWELGLSWHVMIAPDDWARIYLRRRWTEVAPSAAFEISSVAGELEPHAIEPPDAAWR